MTLIRIHSRIIPFPALYLSVPEGPLRWSFGPWAHRGFAAFHGWVAASARQGCNIILDHLMMVDPPVLQDCIWRIADLPVLFVALKPPYHC